MQHDGTLENFTFRGPLYIHEKEPIENILNNNHKHGLKPKGFNKTKIHTKT